MGSIIADILAEFSSTSERLIMPMNEALIKHDLDSEFYELACPTLGTLMLAHFSAMHAGAKLGHSAPRERGAAAE